MCVITEGSDIHAAYTSFFHPDGEDRISLRKVGTNCRILRFDKQKTTICTISAEQNINMNGISK